MADINLQFDKLTKNQRSAFDQTVAWINELISKHDFRLTKTDKRQGCAVEVTRNQDSPVWARMNIRVEFVIGEDIDDNRILSEYSQISADCTMTNPANEEDDVQLGGEWPLTVSGLNKAKQKLERFLVRFKEWNFKSACRGTT